ncbi:MAG: GNAT family N-acetyltransferase [Saprospiraceae bacterium]
MWKSSLLQRNELDDEAWNDFVDASPQQYLYYYTWYLDAACPGWQAIVVEQGGHWVAVMPLPLQRKGSVKYAFQPHLTQFGGIIFVAQEGTRHRYHHFLKTATQHALAALPRDLFGLEVNLHPAVQYFLPFFWEKFEVRPRFTYWLPVDDDFDKLVKCFSSSVINHRKKAQKNGLSIGEGGSPDGLLAIARRERIFGPAEAATFGRVWQAVEKRGDGLLLTAKTPEGAVASAAAFIWDKNKMVFYAIAQDGRHKTSGANALLISEAIHRCCERGGIRNFDFEGSMIETVEQYFRAFNPVAKSYFSIRKTRYPWLFRLYRRIKR